MSATVKLRPPPILVTAASTVEGKSLVAGLEGEKSDELFESGGTAALRAGAATLRVAKKCPDRGRQPCLTAPQEALLGGREAAEHGELVIEVVSEGVQEGVEVLRQADDVRVASCRVRLSGQG